MESPQASYEDRAARAVLVVCGQNGARFNVTLLTTELAAWSFRYGRATSFPTAASARF
jgi:hypothetical protein